ncbi:hypothetical protein [Vibrio mexicanus]|uniref:hypothetical protein n=1 Tax=Vibrio mexicanus TaxID=1004326 RepID=UPI00063CDC50|nr:hypothetical protein [Vibrio mexicanus]
MRATLIKRVAVIITLFVSCALLGNKVYQYNNEPTRVYQGVWEGLGHLNIGGHPLKSEATLIIEPGLARLSIVNSFNEHNYTYDAELLLRRYEHELTHLEVTNRTVNGLDTFIANSNILVPNQGTLLHGNIWRLEEGKLILKMKLTNQQNAIYILEKTAG